MQLKKEREEKRKTQLKSETEKMRSPLAIGLNNVVRCLERDELQLVAVCRGEMTTDLLKMTAHLIPLCASRGCPAVALSHLQTELAPVLSVSSLLALGIKKPVRDDHDLLDELVEYVTLRCKPLEVPWLTDSNDSVVDSNISAMGDSSSVVDSIVGRKTSVDSRNDSVVDQTSMQESGIEATRNSSTDICTNTGTPIWAQPNNPVSENRNISCKPDFSDLYIKKDVSKSHADSQSGPFGSKDFIHFGDQNESGDEVVSYILPKSSKTREVNPNNSNVLRSTISVETETPEAEEEVHVKENRKRKFADMEQTSKSKLMKANIKHKLPNPNKKRKTKKTKKTN